MRASVSWLLVLGVIGCGSATTPAKTEGEAKPTAPPRTLADETDAMCACTKPACADGVRRDFAAVDRETAAGPQPAHVVALTKRIETCEATARELDDLSM